MAKPTYITIYLFFIFVSLAGGIQSVYAQDQKFFVSAEFDAKGREEISAVLLKTSSRANWFAENVWWENLSIGEQAEISSTLDNLIKEFEFKIYPNLTRQFGSEWNPGIDNDSRITVLIHSMNKDAEGYWSSKDEYERLQIPDSNQREIIYLSADRISEPIMKSSLAHEFMHLIVFNQKNVIHGVDEEVWLNEAFAEAAASYLGYDDSYDDSSNLRRRVQEFLARPTNSLLEWQNDPYDYAVINVFMQYFTERYGWGVVRDALQSSETGVDSLNAALDKNNFEKDFRQIFTEWTVAIELNDCSFDEVYCYLNRNLEMLRVAPSVYFLPLSGDGMMAVSFKIKDWSASWYKFIGGHDNFNIEFKKPVGVRVRLPYLIEYKDGRRQVGEVKFDNNSSGKIALSEFGKNINSITIVPSIQESETGSYIGSLPVYTVSWTVTVGDSPNRYTEDTSGDNAREALLTRITELRKTIADLQVRIAAMRGSPANISCGKFQQNLSYGAVGPQVRCLQEFLKKQGPEIYSEGLVTGKFLELTRAAVIRFQNKYTTEILAPVGLSSGTGVFGPMTRIKVNSLLE